MTPFQNSFFSVLSLLFAIFSGNSMGFLYEVCSTLPRLLSGKCTCAAPRAGLAWRAFVSQAHCSDHLLNLRRHLARARLARMLSKAGTRPDGLMFRSASLPCSVSGSWCSSFTRRWVLSRRSWRRRPMRSETRRIPCSTRQAIRSHQAPACSHIVMLADCSLAQPVTDRAALPSLLGLCSLPTLTPRVDCCWFCCRVG